VGTITDLDGKYTLSVPEAATGLVFTFVGMMTQQVDIEGRTKIDVTMMSGDVGLQEVVVTALGISRDKKALGYAVQDVSAEDIGRSSGDANIINSLSGRVAGVQITSSSGNLGGSSRVLLRGASSITGNNQPLYVVDGIPLDNNNYVTTNTARGGGGYDYGNMAQDINPDDIETISVLKGAAAAALYGSRASNGVIIIKTKSGSSRRAGIGVSVSSGVTFEKAFILPSYQNEYGGGYGSTFATAELNGTTYNIPEYNVDESWGPKLDGTTVLPWWGVFAYDEGMSDTYQTAPWSPQPDNIRDYFETGVAYQNNVSMTGGTARNNFRLSYTNLSRTGIFPNSQLGRNTISFSGMSKFGEKLTASTSVNYVNSTSEAIAATGYGANSIMQKFGQWGQRQWDMAKMKEYYVSPTGNHGTWNRRGLTNARPQYSDNPYWTQYMNFPTNDRNRVFGTVDLSYQVLDWLSVSGAFRGDYYTDRQTERVAPGSSELSYYTEAVREQTETNLEFLVKMNKRFSDSFSANGFVGLNRMDRVFSSNIGSTSGGLSTPGLYSLENSKDRPTVVDFESWKRINSIMASASFSFKEFLFMDLTARNDFSSTLPEVESSYFYPSATFSFVFSETAPMQSLNWLSFGKVRFGWAQVGSDTDPYNLYPVYLSLAAFGSNPRFSLPGTLPNAELRPEQTASWEAGLDVRFFNNRVGLDVTYYDALTSDQIIPVQVSSSTGYNFRTVNAGVMRNYGVEAMVNLTPIKTNGFVWDMDINWARNRNEVTELYGQTEVINIGNTNLWGVYVTARLGEPYGMLRGTNYVFDPNGNVVVGSNGLPLVTPGIEELGSVLADWTGGISNSFSYKGFSLRALVDMRKGGHIFSTTSMFGRLAGVLAETAGTNDRGGEVRGDPAENGGLLYNEDLIGYNTVVGYVETDEEGNRTVVVTDETNDIYVSVGDYAGWQYTGPRAQNVFETDFYKLREVSLGYTLPTSLLTKTPFTGVTLSAVGRNLAIWGRKTEHFDPEHATNGGNIQGIEGGANPNTRSLGFNVKIDF